MLGFKCFQSASRTLAGIEIVRMIKKDQVAFPMSTTYKTFCSLAAYRLPERFLFCFHFNRRDRAQLPHGIYKKSK